MQRSSLSIVLGAVSLLLFVAGCECGSAPAPRGTACTTQAQCRGGQICIDGFCAMPRDTGTTEPRDGGPPIDARVAVPTSVTIDPPTAMLMSTDAMMHPTQAFVAQVHYDDGTTRAALVTDWTLSSRETGEIDSAGGTFTANGLVGGTATVNVAATTPQGVLNATATVRVVLERTLIATGAPDTAPATFGSATAVTDPAREAGLARRARPASSIRSTRR